MSGPSTAAPALAPAGPAADVDVDVVVDARSTPDTETCNSAASTVAAAADAAVSDDSELAVSESLLCPICCDLLLLPVVTPCGHAYCLDCFEAWRLHAAASYQTVGSLVGRLHCPVCRTPLPRHFNAGPALPGAGARAGRAAGRAGRSSSGFLSAAMAASAAASVSSSRAGGGSSGGGGAAGGGGGGGSWAPPLAPCAALGDAVAALCPARHAERLARRREQLQRLRDFKEAQAAAGGQGGRRQRGHGRPSSGGGGGGDGAASAAAAGEPWLTDSAAVVLERSASGASASSSRGGDGGVDGGERAPQPHDLAGLPWPLRTAAAPWRRLCRAARRAFRALSSRLLLPPPPAPPPPFGAAAGPWHAPGQPSALELLVTWGLLGVYAASCGCIAAAVLDDAGAALRRGLGRLRRSGSGGRSQPPRLWRRLVTAVTAALGGHRHRRYESDGHNRRGATRAGAGGEGGLGTWRLALPGGGRDRAAQQRQQQRQQQQRWPALPRWPFAWPAAGGLLPLGVLVGGDRELSGGGGSSSGSGSLGSHGGGGLLRELLLRTEDQDWAARRQAGGLHGGFGGGGSSGSEEEGGRAPGRRQRAAVVAAGGASGVIVRSTGVGRRVDRARHEQQQQRRMGLVGSGRADMWAARTKLQAEGS
ncbi:hypothetical protein HYH02_000135 [Chlamydomonas schloesseri]|uniref:RING-type domain-containing protein n=1 Tax=Chlamydomonas schloesseri TaxID=2026947 RepID=A0A835WN88_9CHLO|nr:hypothetical protein HYH02_000135 [Chlamydomonas schloesseri]|eukprot:KAG2450031.1 hypothetical protein HYH02_000135 [Chlamydomonas schloesseri]